MKIAVILFNLGAPDQPSAVEPFLINLFSDPAIIGVPQPFRAILAQFLGKRRARVAQGIYELIGGGSPLLPNTLAQAHSLSDALSKRHGEKNTHYKIFTAMRYWHPMTDETVAKVAEYQPDTIILLPLYPQYSTTTSASSLKAWQKQAKKMNLSVPTKIICCYPMLDGFVDTMVERIKPVYQQARQHGATKLLFSAHGLPKKIIKKGDPYQYQVEQTAKAIVDKLAIENLDWQVCYQSRVGPLEWIGPATDAEIIAAGKNTQNIVLCPIAFVSEHSETLVELDIEYRHLATENGVPRYDRVATASCHDEFIKSLAIMIEQTLASPDNLRSNEGKPLCPPENCLCAYQVNA